MNTDKTLAVVQPGGRVRLQQELPPEGYAGAWIRSAYGQPSSFTYWNMEVAYAAGWQAALSAQSSPGGQRDDSPMAKMAAALRGKAEAERAAFDQRVQSGEWGPMPDNPDVLELPPLPEEVDSVSCMIRGEKGFAEPCDYYFTSKQMRDYARTALAARQPVGEPVAEAIEQLSDDVESCVSDACAYLASDSGWDDYGIYRDDAKERYRALPDRIRALANPPAQAVDLGPFRPFVEAQRNEYISHGLTSENASVAECDELLAMIDSQAVGK